MRKKEEIAHDARVAKLSMFEVLYLEVLLDIRNILKFNIEHRIGKIKET